jgi:sugar O-acyltransferase (sialic acid O-acetyltransferase NeuD family)
VTLFIVGAGGLGRETYDAALAAGLDVDGFLDENLAGQVIRGRDVLRPAEVRGPASYVVGIAYPAVRRRLSAELEERGLTPTSVVHPRAIVGPETSLGNGCVVLGGAHVSSSVRAGAHVHVHYNATVGHDAVLGDRASIYPGANVAGNVTLDADVTIGSNAAVLQNLTIGEGTFVGAGSVVTRSLGPGLIVAGVPARPLKRPPHETP